MMNDEYEADLITLVDDEGNEHEFEIIDEIDYEDGHYMALMPTGDDPEKEISSDTITFLKWWKKTARSSWPKWKTMSFGIVWPTCSKNAMPTASRMKTRKKTTSNSSAKTV